MLTDRQRSFIATVEAVDGSFNFLDQLLGKPAVLVTPPITIPAGLQKIPKARGYLQTVMVPEHVIPGSKRDQSNYLGHVHGPATAPPLCLYFRCIDNGYRLFVRSSVRYKHALYIHEENCVCALNSPFNGVYPTLFDLLDTNDTPIAFDDLEDETIVRLTPAGKRAPLMLRSFKDNPYTYICTKGQRPLELRLHILERNAAYLNDPDEV